MSCVEPGEATIEMSSMASKAASPVGWSASPVKCTPLGSLPSVPPHRPNGCRFGRGVGAAGWAGAASQ